MARSALLPGESSTALLRGWVIVAALLAGAAGVARGQPPGQDVPARSVETPPRTIGSKPSRRITDVCVKVDLAGHKAGDLECSAQALDAAVKSAQQRARMTANLAAADARSADVVTGVANQTATRQRMGNSYGVSARPQRPGSVPIPPRGQTP